MSGLVTRGPSVFATNDRYLAVLMTSLRAQQEQSATFVELFFDLVFVYAVTQLTAFVIHDLTWSGVGHAALLFWLVWWSWTQFTWTLNPADTEHPTVRLTTLGATATAFFLAQAIPDAYGSAGMWFAVSYVVVRGLGLRLQSRVLASDQGSPTSWIIASMPGLAMVLIGGFVAADVRVWFWLAALAFDLAAASVGGRRDMWPIAAEHFAERHGLIVIIALGESLIAAGVASSDVARTTGFAVTTAGAVVGTCALWWTYFGTLQPMLERRLADQAIVDRGVFARDVFSLWHAWVVAGVVGVAVAFEEAVAHPDEMLSSEAALALTLGAAMFLGGLAGAAWRSGLRSQSAIRLIAGVTVLAATPAVARVPGYAALWGLALVVIAVDLFDWRRSVTVSTRS